MSNCKKIKLLPLFRWAAWTIQRSWQRIGVKHNWHAHRHTNTTQKLKKKFKKFKKKRVFKCNVWIFLSPLGNDANVYRQNFQGQQAHPYPWKWLHPMINLKTSYTDKSPFLSTRPNFDTYLSFIRAFDWSDKFSTQLTLSKWQVRFGQVWSPPNVYLLLSDGYHFLAQMSIRRLLKPPTLPW